MQKKDFQLKKQDNTSFIPIKKKIIKESKYYNAFIIMNDATRRIHACSLKCDITFLLGFFLVTQLFNSRMTRKNYKNIIENFGLMIQGIT